MTIDERLRVVFWLAVPPPAGKDGCEACPGVIVVGGTESHGTRSMECACGRPMAGPFRGVIGEDWRPGSSELVAPVEWVGRVAEAFARERHAEQLYGPSEPYVVHLAEVAALVREWTAGIGNFSGMRGTLEAAAWLHDVVEDTRTTIEEVEDAFGRRVAQIVGAVTSEPGPNRAARNAATYRKVRADWLALVVKLADRVANARRGRLVPMYRKEYAGFREALFEQGLLFEAAWAELDALLGPVHR